MCVCHHTTYTLIKFPQTQYLLELSIRASEIKLLVMYTGKLKYKQGLWSLKNIVEML